MKVIQSEAQYNEQINQDKVTIIKFKTGWCPDCRNLDRFIGDIIAEHPEIDWLEMDAEEFQPIAEANQVRGIPSLIAFTKGEKIGHLHSKFAKTPDQIREYLNDMTNPKFS